MKLTFCKYDGAGNDFVLVDARTGDVNLSTDQIARICHRRFGVGADGLMTLSLPPAESDYDFEMAYYNSDGRLGSMCGNGGRCISAFADRLGLGSVDPESGHKLLHFMAYDGPHHAEVLMWHEEERIGLVRLGMRDVPCDAVTRCLDGWFLDTGSPHYVQRVTDLDHFDVVGEGRKLRNRTDVFPEGTNVDFIEDGENGMLKVRTYERGVEDETWACGTGVTASALVTGNGRVVTRGGDFKVDFRATGSSYVDILLTGPVAYNFSGEMII